MTRTKFSADLKKKVALEALKERKTLREIASDYGISPSQVTRWKDELISGASDIFEKGKSKEAIKVKELEEKEGQFHKKIGQLTLEVDFLKKKLDQMK